jgi:tetratricopeptide (TPR) repeat protein
MQQRYSGIERPCLAVTKASAITRELLRPPRQSGISGAVLEVPARRVEGITAFENLMKSSPSASGYYLMACGLQKESRHEEAVQAFCEAARLDGSPHADFHFNHATSLGALGRLEEAADAYQAAAHLNPSDGDAWGNLGATLAELCRWKEAAPCQERAMRLAPSLLHGLNLGVTLFELNRLDDAERVLRESLVIEPRSTEAKEALAAVLIGQDRYDEALMLTRELCAPKPVALSSRVLLAGALMESGRLQEALHEAIAAGEADPSDPRPQGVLSFVYVKMNNGSAALAACDRAESLAQSEPWASYAVSRRWNAIGRGNALSVLGRHEEAMLAFEEALRIDPGFFERWPDMALHYNRSFQETSHHPSAGR